VNIEDKTRCIERVWGTERFSTYHQCQRKRGHGPDGLYCKQHSRKYAPDADKVEILGVTTRYSDDVDIQSVMALDQGKSFLCDKHLTSFGDRLRVPKGDVYLCRADAVKAAWELCLTEIVDCKRRLERLERRGRELDAERGA